MVTLRPTSVHLSQGVAHIASWMLYLKKRFCIAYGFEGPCNNLHFQATLTEVASPQLSQPCLHPNCGKNHDIMVLGQYGLASIFSASRSFIFKRTFDL
jgi:hypothetical protein